MGKLQHRRSISIRGTVHARLRTYCEANGIPLAAFTEELLATALDAAGAPRPVIEPKGYPKHRRETADALSRELATRRPASFTF